MLCLFSLLNVFSTFSKQGEVQMDKRAYVLLDFVH